jgi:uncharacterized protein YndB with AHSA1/START domain
MGILRAHRERRAVRFERLYDFDPGEVWSAISDPERVTRWLARVERWEPEVGGSIVLEFGDEPEGRTELRVRELDPGRVLEVDWHYPGEDRSVVRFEVVPQDGGTLLVLDHRSLDAAAAPGYGAGWHAHLDALEALLAGRDEADDIWWDRFTSRRPAYEGVGIVAASGDAFSVSFDRRISAPVEAVWAAVTEREQLTRWFTDTTIEQRVGGDVVVDFGEAGSASGTVLAWQPPRLLELEWRSDVTSASILRVELEPDGEGTRLRLEHRNISEELAQDLGAGWHAYLDGLADLFDGTSGDWTERERRVRPLYEHQASVT